MVDAVSTLARSKNRTSTILTAIHLVRMLNPDVTPADRAEDIFLVIGHQYLLQNESAGTSFLSRALTRSYCLSVSLTRW
ncbi:MAG: hypothetical protein ACW985_11545, partial [Candidatus Thorarchaeota archaeon]